MFIITLNGIVESFPCTEAMILADIKPYASCIWNWGKSQMGANLIEVGAKELILTLLPRAIGRFSRFGLKVNKMRYHCDGYTEKYLNGGEVMVAYNPEDVTSVWLVGKGIYTEFTIIESRLEGKELTAVQSLRMAQRAIARGVKRDNLQAQIGLARHIETIAGNVGGSIDVSIKNIRDTRKQEQSKRRRLYERSRLMTNLSDIINDLPRMKSGDSLITALEVLSGYNPEICKGDASVRLMALSDLYKVYIPSQMSLEIYSKLYLTLLRSMQKKGTKLAVQQQNQNYRAIMKQEYRHHGRL